ncbi:MAG: ribbon-helix-helix protein, CopG family [DPANN group archaeon]|nr:ribbon-helix-helix protein, CopG family [DPANN group archaeon]
MNRIEISDETIKRIDELVKAGRFKDLSDFINQAIKLLVYAEENKEQFQQIVKQE